MLPGDTLSGHEATPAEVLGAMVNHSPIGLVVVDLETLRLLQFNDTLCVYLGYSREELAGLTLFDLSVQEPQRVQDQIEARLAQPQLDFERLVRTKQGGVRRMRIRTQLTQVRGRACSVAFWLDITEERAAEDRLAHAVRIGDFFLHSWRCLPDAPETVYVSPRAHEIAGVVTQGPALVRELIAMLHHDDQDLMHQRMGEMGRSMTGFSIELRHHHPERGWIWLAVACMPERDASGTLIVHSLARDISLTKQREDLLRNFASHTSQGLLCLRRLPDGVLQPMFRNDAALALLGVQAEHMLQPLTWWQHVLPEDAEAARASLAGGVPCTLELRVARPAQALVWLRCSCAPQVDLDGATIWHLVLDDISAHKQAQAELYARAQTLQSMIEHAPDAIIRYDPTLRRVHANPATVALLGFAPQDLVDAPFPRRTTMLDPTLYEDKLREVFAVGETEDFEMSFVRTGETQVRTAHVRMAAERHAQGGVASVLAVIRDISDLADAREALRRSAATDALTGLPNRTWLGERLREAVARAERDHQSVAVLMIDLDRFKDINDTFGHAVGDALLCEVAQRLRVCLNRADDLVARLGGDEFVMLLPAVRDAAGAAVVAERLMRALRQPVVVQQGELCVSASIGIALAPQDCCDAVALLAHADAAMYEAKRCGRDGFSFYTQNLTAEAGLRLKIRAGLRHAVARGELDVFYQPKVDLVDDTVVAAEALLRWRHPELGLLTPDKFIGIAEDTGVIVEIGAWVLAQAVRQAVELNTGRHRPVRIAVNLSPRQFDDGRLLDTVRAVLTASACPPAWLELEITESLMLGGGAAIQDQMHALSALGVTLALDDFGTGHSALGYLNQFELDVLKIDRTFVRGAATDAKRGALIHAFVGVARALGMGTVAEGVETAEDAAFMRAARCDLAQGWLYGRPMTADAFARLLDAPA